MVGLAMATQSGVTVAMGGLKGVNVNVGDAALDEAGSSVLVPVGKACSKREKGELSAGSLVLAHHEPSRPRLQAPARQLRLTKTPIRSRLLERAFRTGVSNFCDMAG